MSMPLTNTHFYTIRLSADLVGAYTLYQRYTPSPHPALGE